VVALAVRVREVAARIHSRPKAAVLSIANADAIGPSISRQFANQGRPIQISMNSQSTQRRTVAVLIDFMNLFAGGYEAEFRGLFERYARIHDLNLLFAYGRGIGHPDPAFAAHNRIYELLGARRVSGVVTLSSCIMSFCGLEGAQTFFGRYAKLARCSVGLAIPTVPSIEIDNRTGMRALVEHLISQHAYRRIAFVRGPVENVEANWRFAAYREALGAHGIAFDERLVKVGDFARKTGAVATKLLLGQGGSRPEAIVFANDGMALGAISFLRTQGIHVPEDIAVGGFDDLVMARLGDPPLTTVSQPVERMVECAFDLIVRQLSGCAVPDTTSLGAEFVIRESCGCGGGHLDVNTPAARIASLGSSSREAIAALARERYRSAPTGGTSARDGHLARLLDALAREFEGEKGALVRELEDMLFDTEDNEAFQILIRKIERLRYEFAPVATPELDDLWYHACTHIALTNTRRQEQWRLDYDQIYYRWIDVGEGFSAALDLPTLAPALSQALLTIGVKDAFVSRYADAGQRELECIVALRNGAVYDPPARRFPADALMPEGAFPETRRVTCLVFPLAFHAQNLGVALFELRENVGGYPIIRDQISAVLQSIALHQEIIDQTRLHERRSQEQERQATAARIHSLSVLAGGVAHDLNNVLGPLVALPDLMTDELQRLALPAELAETNLAADLEAIKAAALRATQTIKDLLTLGRRGHAARQPLDLNQAIARLVAHEGKHASRFDARVSVELCDEALYIVGSETHIDRAIVNLVRNALDAIDDHGQVRLRTEALTVHEPISGYELVECGSYAVVSVSDTGCGVPASKLGRLFEPFFSMKRLSDQSGSGLGLAIVHGVVKEHGGFIDVESTDGAGTTFTLYLPRGEAVAEPAAVISVAPRGQARILVVDDEPLQLRTCRRVLTHLGYYVDTLSSGQAALAHLKSVAQGSADANSGPGQCPYDLVILDMHLDEEQDGLWFFDRIRGLYPQQRGLIASGHAPTEMVELARQRGLTWLAKPYTQSTLGRAVQSVLGTVASPPK
jgi:phosphoserine phosphatase RsbU/P